MQINRLFEIVYILLNKKQVTAKELSERFEVSTRTIYRDIESLCQAGIPIYTNKGKGGGICLLDHFVLNKSYLSEKEQQEIIVALQGLQVTPYMPQNEVLSKLSALFGSNEQEWIAVDFGSWDTSEKEKFEQIKEAILNKKYIQFDYYNTNLEKLNRKVEPLQLYFKEKTWYLKGYCTLRKQIRLFKLRRIKEMVCLEESFEKQKHEEQKYEEKKIDVLDTSVAKTQTIKLWLDQTQGYRVFDEFDENQVTKQQDGSFIVNLNYPKDEWLFGYLLSFGHYAKVLEPMEIAKELKGRLWKAINQYETE